MKPKSPIELGIISFKLPVTLDDLYAVSRRMGMYGNGKFLFLASEGGWLPVPPPFIFAVSFAVLESLTFRDSRGKVRKPKLSARNAEIVACALPKLVSPEVVGLDHTATNITGIGRPPESVDKAGARLAAVLREALEEALARTSGDSWVNLMSDDGELAEIGGAK